MEFLKLLSVLLFSVFLISRAPVECSTFHPLAYASNHFFIIDRKPANEIRSDLQKVVKNFLAVHVRSLLQHLPEIHLRRDAAAQSGYAQSIREQVSSLLETADNKRKLAKRIRDAYDRAAAGPEGKRSEQKSKLLRQNLNEVQNLLRRAQELEEKAQHLNDHLEELMSGMNSRKASCDIHKRGHVGYVSSRSGLKHVLDNVKAEVDSEGLTLFDKNERKVVYVWHLMEPPFKVIGHVNQCFYFTYRNQQPLFCAGSVAEAHAWINALTEGYLCSIFDIRGTVVNKNMDVDTLRADPNIVTVEIHPEETGARIILDQAEHHVSDSDEIDINALKNNLENERKEDQAETGEE